ncbi:MAG: hypothetical protein IJA32_07895 [Lachnospiraceae bacterium]|nr:hypothetical protein [Lachnospiraceae bacterium]
MKFCTKCGKQLEDNEVCSCTTQNVVNDPFQQTTEQETFYQSSQTTFEGNNSQPVFNTNAVNEPVQGSSKKTIIGLVAAAAVVVVLGILLVVSLAGGGYKKPVDKICKTINKQEKDIDKLVGAFLPDFADDAYSDFMKIMKDSDEVADAYEEAEDSMEELYESLEDSFGDDVKVTYEIKKKEKMDKDDLEDIEETIHDFYDSYLDEIVDKIDDMDSDDWEDMADDLDISESKAKKVGKVIKSFAKELEKAKVSSGYTLKVKIKIEGDEDDASETFKFNVIKVNGDWMIDYFTLFEENSNLLYDLMY